MRPSRFAIAYSLFWTIMQTVLYIYGKYETTKWLNMRTFYTNIHYLYYEDIYFYFFLFYMKLCILLAYIFLSIANAVSNKIHFSYIFQQISWCLYFILLYTYGKYATKKWLNISNFYIVIIYIMRIYIFLSFVYWLIYLFMKLCILLAHIFLSIA